MRTLALPLAAMIALAGCTPAVDNDMIEQMEGAVRNGLAAQGTVKQVELTRESDDRMTGYAVVEPSNSPGSEVRFTCTASRQAETGSMFNWECVPPGAPAPADAAAAPPADAGEAAAADEGEKP